jgi:hypothetical protein
MFMSKDMQMIFMAAGWLLIRQPVGLCSLAHTLAYVNIKLFFKKYEPFSGFNYNFPALLAVP